VQLQETSVRGGSLGTNGSSLLDRALFPSALGTLHKFTFEAQPELLDSHLSQVPLDESVPWFAQKLRQ